MTLHAQIWCFSLCLAPTKKNRLWLIWAYHHCKGCLRCVDVCPTNALVAGLEREHPDKKWFVRNKDLIVDKLEYEDAGANSWVTSEAYLDEKRVDGGIV